MASAIAEVFFLSYTLPLHVSAGLRLERLYPHLSVKFPRHPSFRLAKAFPMWVFLQFRFKSLHFDFIKAAQANLHPAGAILSICDLAPAAEYVPLSADVFALHDRSHRGMGTAQRHLARAAAHRSLPPVGRAWVWSGTEEKTKSKCKIINVKPQKWAANFQILHLKFYILRFWKP